MAGAYSYGIRGYYNPFYAMILIDRYNGNIEKLAYYFLGGISAGFGVL